MQTDVVLFRGDPKEDEELLQRAGKIIREGGLVAMPTETVYGLAGDALNPTSSERIYAAKGRPSDNPLIVHIADMDALQDIAVDIPEKAWKLADRFWPGPLTMILRKSALVPKETTGGLDTVAVRFPSHPAAMGLIKASGRPLAAPSANRSGRPSCTAASHVLEDMNGIIPLIIDGGKVGIGLESTIIDLTSDIPMLLRPGYIGVETLEQLLGRIEVDPSVNGLTDKSAHPKAPGMKYKHYAPKGELCIVKGPEDRVVETINALSSEKEKEGKKTAVIAAEETAPRYQCPLVRTIGSRTRENEIARNLFQVLREMDDLGADVIYTEEFDTPHLGMAIMNRLIRAAGHRIIRL